MNCVSLISSGIDSPVATYLIGKYVDSLLLLHVDNRPYTDEQEITNFIALANHLKTKISKDISLYLVSHGNALRMYQKVADPHFTCVFCKRMMVRYAQAVAQKQGADAIVMGDSLGQVASQTLQNIRVIDEAVQIPILRPLLGFDKQEVVRIAKQIGTYELSIQPSLGCTAVPSKPSTKATIERMHAEESKIDVSGLLADALEHMTFLK